MRPSLYSIYLKPVSHSPSVRKTLSSLLHALASHVEALLEQLPDESGTHGGAAVEAALDHADAASDALRRASNREQERRM
jgi:uncharacterized membrane protein YccC